MGSNERREQVHCTVWPCIVNEEERVQDKDEKARRGQSTWLGLSNVRKRVIKLDYVTTFFIFFFLSKIEIINLHSIV